MKVSGKDIPDVLAFLLEQDEIGFDTETYGIGWGMRMFAMQMYAGGQGFYFNFHDYRDDTHVLPRNRTLTRLKPLFNNREKKYFIHNAKFDLHRLHYHDTYLQGYVHDTEVVERLLNNQHMRYSLDACLQRRKLGGKDTTVKEWISKNKAYTVNDIPGKKRRSKDLHFDRVPFEIMYKYGMMDAKAVYDLGTHQLDEMKTSKTDTTLYNTEMKLTKVLAKVEQRGVRVDKDYAKQGWVHEEIKKQEAENTLTRLGGSAFRNGPKWLRSVFDSQGVAYSINPETGNPVFDKKALEQIQHPVVSAVLEYRRAEKYVSTYYSDFIYRVDHHDIIHANIRQAGTDTGRFSYSEPNLQNVPKEEDFAEGDIQVRKCLIPREGYSLVGIDFSQQEFRLMLDYANERKVIQKVMDGEDLHQATADMVGVTRKQAKTLNFGLLYGMGVEKLAGSLKVSEREAAKIRLQYFNKLPRVEHFISDVINKARHRKWIRTWAGRTLKFPKKDFSYKAPNHLIQGGCGDIARIAMVQLDEFLQGKDAHMLIQVHDEIVFEIADNELGIIPELSNIMKNIYTPFNGMYMDCTAELSKVSWGQQDMKEI